MPCQNDECSSLSHFTNAIGLLHLKYALQHLKSYITPESLEKVKA
jgi:hypothetical protein